MDLVSCCLSVGLHNTQGGGGGLPQVTVEFEEAYAREHLKQRKQVCLLFSGIFFWLSLLCNSSED